MVVVTWMARRPSVEWPEKHFCNDEFFKCDFFSHLGIRQIGRVVKNEDAVVNKLMELETRKYPDGRRVVFRPKVLFPFCSTICADRMQQLRED